MAPDHDRYLGTKYFASLDGLRCISILAVIWHHTRLEEAGSRLASRGFLGVDLFFVLSGFLIVTLLLRERDRNDRISLGKFYVRRFFRIFPLYYGVIALLTVLFWMRSTASGRQAWFEELPILVTYTANWFEITTFMAIAWSLAAEEQFYLFWPPLEKSLGSRILWVLVAVLILNQLVMLRVFDHVLVDTGLDPYRFEILQSTFHPILLGVLLAHVLHKPSGFEAVNRFFASRWSSPLMLSTLVALVAWAPDDLRGWGRMLIHFAMVGLVASCVVREDHYLRPLLAWKPVQRMGLISYGMYLLHHIGLFVATFMLARLGWLSSNALFAVGLMATVLISEASFRFYETPFLRLKQRLGRVPSP